VQKGGRHGNVGSTNGGGVVVGVVLGVQKGGRHGNVGSTNGGGVVVVVGGGVVVGTSVVGVGMGVKDGGCCTLLRGTQV
jgi:hypothetical protein